MENEIKKFDVNEAMLSVKDKIKDAFVSLIPDEQWNEMVKKEIDSYFGVTGDGYGERGSSSSFTKTVHSVLDLEVRERVKTYLTENFQSTWYNSGVPVCNAKIEEFITQNSGKILSDMIGGTIQSALSMAGYNMR